MEDGTDPFKPPPSTFPCLFPVSTFSPSTPPPPSTPSPPKPPTYICQGLNKEAFGISIYQVRGFHLVSIPAAFKGSSKEPRAEWTSGEFVRTPKGEHFAEVSVRGVNQCALTAFEQEPSEAPPELTTSSKRSHPPRRWVPGGSVAA